MAVACTQMNAGFAEAQASTKMGMVCATTWIHVWGNSTNAVCATAQASWTERAIATGTSWTPSVNAAAPVPPMRTPTGCATMWTPAWACWTPVVCATAPARCTNAVARPFWKETAIATATNWMRWVNAVATVRPTPTATGCATWTKWWGVWRLWRATSTLLPRTATPICACTHSPHAKPVLAPRTAAGWCWPTTTIWTACATPMKWKGAKTRLRAITTPWPRTRFPASTPWDATSVLEEPWARDS